MRFVDLALCAAFALASVGCSDSPEEPEMPASCAVSGSSNSVTTSTPAPSGINVMTVTVNGSLCGSDSYPNQPCTSVQVCTPGGACATINNLLVDTGSYGLRVFKSVLTAAGVTPATISAGAGRTLAECVGFGDGSSEWGQVATVDMILGGEDKITDVPIHVIDSTFSSPPFHCSAAGSVPDVGPSIGFNGILGVGLFAEDCGGYCATQVNNGMYYACNSSDCNPSSAALADQVVNPVALIGPDATNGGLSDNNGVVMQLPAVPDSGAASVTGYMLLGIGTRSNNTPSGVQRYDADSYGTFRTVFSPFSSSPLESFIDSGSSLLFFPWPPPSNPDLASLIPDCSVSHGAGLSGFYCPGATRVTSAANTGDGGSASSCVGFQIANAYSQLAPGTSNVFHNLAGTAGDSLGSVFDWGLPFFLGRKVYVGIEATSSSLGTGPYWAY
jgi:hypothetical protein